MLLGRLSNTLTVDQKGRITIPARVREGAGVPAPLPGESPVHRPVDFYVGCPRGYCLYLHTEEQHEAYLDATESVVGVTEEERLAMSMFNAAFVLVTTDKSNRITIPSFLLEELGIKHKDEVMLIGSRQRVEIWEVETQKATAKKLAEKFQKVMQRADQRLSDQALERKKQGSEVDE